MNWVEKRLARAKALEFGAPGLWNAIRSAMQGACNTFNGHCATNVDQRVKCRFENGRRIRVQIAHRLKNPQGHRDETACIVVAIDGSSVVAAGWDSGSSTKFDITSSESEVFVLRHQERLDPDEISRLILEPLLFPSGNRSLLPSRQLKG